MKTYQIIILILVVYGFYRSNTILFDNPKLNKPMRQNVEGFISKRSKTRETAVDIYDNFYSRIYDKLFGSTIRVEYEYMSTSSKYIK